MYIENPDGPDWLSPSVTTFAGDGENSHWVECDECGDLWDVVGASSEAQADAHLTEHDDTTGPWVIVDGRHTCPECAA